jgi:peptidyl-prolyl cis-trans isomerase D
MLQSIRERSKGVVAWVIIVLIIIPFALFGIDQFTSGDKIEIAAKVNGNPVMIADFERSFDTVKRQYQENFGEMYASLVQEDKLRQQVLDDLIQRNAINQKTTSEGFAISDAQLMQIIQGQKMFQDKGAFSLSRYEDVLKNNAYSKERFEQSQRQFMQRSQFDGIASASEIIGDSEVSALAGLESQQREVGYLRIDHRPFLTTENVKDEQIKSYYDANLDKFKSSEQVELDYIRLSVDALLKSIKVTDDQLLAYYKDHADKVQLPEKRNVRHILIMAAKDADTKIDTDAKAKAEALLAQITSGADFAKLAKENSQDPGSASHGGELGFFQHGDMVPEFETAAFSLAKVGDISPVIRTSYGYHFLQLIAIEPAQTPAFEKVRDVMAMELKTELAMKDYSQRLEQLKTLVYEQSDSLEPAAKALGLTIEHSVILGKEGGDDVFAAQPVINAAFSTPVVKEKLNSAVIETESGEAIVLRLRQHYPEHEKALAEVTEDIRLQLTRQVAIEQAKRKASELLTEVKKSTVNDPASMVKAGIEWQASEWMARNSDKVLPEILSAAFKVAKPKEGQPTWLEHRLTTGDSVLIRISGVRQDVEKTKQIEAELKQAALQVFGDAMIDALGASVKSKADVEILLK